MESCCAYAPLCGERCPCSSTTRSPRPSCRAAECEESDDGVRVRAKRRHGSDLLQSNAHVSSASVKTLCRSDQREQVSVYRGSHAVPHVEVNRGFCGLVWQCTAFQYHSLVLWLSYSTPIFVTMTRLLLFQRSTRSPQADVSTQSSLFTAVTVRNECLRAGLPTSLHPPLSTSLFCFPPRRRREGVDATSCAKPTCGWCTPVVSASRRSLWSSSVQAWIVCSPPLLLSLGHRLLQLCVAPSHDWPGPPTDVLLHVAVTAAEAGR